MSSRKLGVIQGGLLPPYTDSDFLHTGADVVWFTAAIARDWRADHHYERQRRIHGGNVERLAHEMKTGNFVTGTPIFCCRTPDGRRYIVNGNHTLEAVALSGVEIPLTVITVEVADMVAVNRIYAVQDNQRARTWRDRISAYGLGETVPYAQRVTAAVRYIENKFGPFEKQVSTGERLALVEEYRREMQLLSMAMRGADTKSIHLTLRGPVLSIAIVTFRYQPQMAHEFWSGFMRDDGLRSHDPRKALLKYFKDIAYRSNRTDNFLFLRATAQAWNAFYTAEDCHRLFPSHMEKVSIEGTPYTAENAPSKALPQPKKKR